jgi:hypothetical protein
MILLDELEDDISHPAKPHDRPVGSSPAQRPGSPESFVSSTTLNGSQYHNQPHVISYPPNYDAGAVDRIMTPGSFWEKWEGRLGLKVKRPFGKVVLRVLVGYFVLTVIILVIVIPVVVMVCLIQVRQTNPLITSRQRTHHAQAEEQTWVFNADNFYSNSTMSSLIASDDITSIVSCGNWTTQGLMNTSTNLYASRCICTSI